MMKLLDQEILYKLVARQYLPRDNTTAIVSNIYNPFAMLSYV